ncbi:MAG: discoidin domain-containing protein [Bacteroidaceae bacterium]|nr:discoidin domain-containing protein [Bacteroidaceae bacterium]
MMLFVQLITTGGVFAADPPKAEYDAAMATINDGSAYYIVTEVDGIKFYVTETGDLTEDEDLRTLFVLTKTSGGALYDVGIRIDGGTGKVFTNTNQASDKAVLEPGSFILTDANDRNDWERQVFFMNEEGMMAIRTCNTSYGESGWSDCGRCFWTYKDDEGWIIPCYSYEPAYIWTLEEPEDRVQIAAVLQGTINTKVGIGEYTYGDFYYDDFDDGAGILSIGEEFGQLSDLESYKKFREIIVQIMDYVTDYEKDPDGADIPTLDEAKAMKATADSLFQVVLDSEIPYVMPQDGYYRIIAHNRYKSKYDESGFVDKAIAASYEKAHEGKAVLGTLKRDMANYVWKLTKSETGDSIMIQNAGMGTYISLSLSDKSDNKVVMTEDITDASYVMFDYAGMDYVEPDGEGDDRDIFAIRLASGTRGKDGRYIHQMNHSSVTDNTSPWGNYGTDTGVDQELGFWIRTFDTGRTTDKWCSEWFLEFVPEDEVAQLIEDFEPLVNHDLLVQKNQELRDKVAESIALAKDVTKTKQITSANQFDNRFGDPSEGTNPGNLIDGDASTFWHTTWHGLADGVDQFFYYGEGYEEGLECHYLQISGMENLVGNCELYLRERASANNDRVKTLVLMGTDNLKNEDDEWEEILRVTLPHVEAGEENTVPFTVAEAYPYIRLFAIEVDSKEYDYRQFWHAAEIQLYTVEENPNSQFVLMGEVAEELENTYNANCATPDADITPDIYQALLDAYNAFLAAGLVDPAELRDALAAYAKVTEGVVEGKEPGQWADLTVPNAYNDLYAEVEAYNKAGKYDVAQIHKYAVMLKAMQKSVMEQANGVKTDKWYRIMAPTEEMFDAYEFSKEGVDKANELVEDQWNVCGTFVAPAQAVTEEVATPTEEKPDSVTNMLRLEAIGGEDLRESNRLFFMAEDEIEDKDASMFRFIEKEAEGVDYVPLFQDAKENMAMALDMSTTYTRVDTLITKASQLSSNASDEAEGKDLGALIDNNPSTFWHSDWHVKVIAPPYLQVALNEPVSGLIQVDIVRRNNEFGHIVRMYVQGSNDAETWTNIGYLEAPYGGTAGESVTCQPIDLGGEFSYLRFINTCRWLNGGGNSAEMDPFAEPKSADEYDKTWTYFHAAEFQIYTVEADKELSASAQAVLQAYTAANKILLKDATAEDLAAAAQGYKAFRSEFNAQQGKAVLPNGLEKVAPVYALQNKATGLFIFANDGKGGNTNNMYLKTIPTFFDYKALGYERGLMHGTNINGSNPNNLHVGESNRRLCTWGSTEPTSNSGLVIREADEEYAAPESFTYYKDIKPGRIADWCNSVTITPVDAPEEAVAYTAVGQYTVEDEGVFLALKAIETIEAGQPALYIYGDTTTYDAEDDYVEPVQFTMPGTPELVVKGDTINGLIGTLVPLTLDEYEIRFNANYVEVGGGITACSAYISLDSCPEVDPEGDYDFSIFLGEAGDDVTDGVKNVNTALEKISKAGNVYSIDGKLLRTGATLNSLKTLGKGMYILNGVKVLVK